MGKGECCFYLSGSAALGHVMFSVFGKQLPRLLQIFPTDPVFHNVVLARASSRVVSIEKGVKSVNGTNLTRLQNR